MDISDETAKDVIVAEERKPVLYDAKDRPLARPMGFRSKSERKDAG